MTYFTLKVTPDTESVCETPRDKGTMESKEMDRNKKEEKKER